MNGFAVHWKYSLRVNDFVVHWKYSLRVNDFVVHWKYSLRSYFRSEDRELT